MIRRLIQFLCLALILAGCSSGHEVDSLLVAGSSSFLSFSQAMADEFMKTHPHLQVICEGGGSYAGLMAVKRGAINVAIMSREMPDEQDDDAVRSYMIARDGVGIIVHPSNPVSNLSIDQIRGIFSGKITRWEEVGGKPGPIAVYSRDTNSTTREGIENMVMRGENILKSAIVAPESDEMEQLVSKDPRAIGFISTHASRPNVKFLSVEGVPVSRITILSERYPLSRSLDFVICDRDSDDGDAAANRKAQALTKQFIDYCLSPDGQKLLDKEGLFPVN